MEGDEQGLSRVRKVKNYKSLEMGVSPCETHLGLLTDPYQSLAPIFPQRLGDRGPTFSC